MILRRGAAIAAEELPFVFERYYRGRLADSAAARPASGDDYRRGLGLAIARRVAQANGWRLTVQAAQPSGTRFVIALNDAVLTQA